MLNIIELTFDCVSEISFIHTPSLYEKCEIITIWNMLTKLLIMTVCTATQSVTRVSEHLMIYFSFGNLIIII